MLLRLATSCLSEVKSLLLNSMKMDRRVLILLIMFPRTSLMKLIVVANAKLRLKVHLL